MNKICKKCGKKVFQNATFCGYCGSNEFNAENTIAPNQSYKNNKKILIVGFVILLIIFGVIFMIDQIKDRQTNIDNVAGKEYYKKGFSAYNSGNNVEAVELYRQACSLNNGEGCRALGVMYKNGDAVLQNKLKAVNLFFKSCQNEDMIGCNLSGMMYLDPSLKQNIDFGNEADIVGILYKTKGYTSKKSFSFFQKACNGGLIEGCNNLGIMYYIGSGVKKDYIKTAELYQKACNANLKSGCNNLANMYVKGNGVPINYAKAASLYKKDCSDNYAMSCANLGLMYSFGKGVSVDNVEAAKLFGKACGGNIGLGCYLLGDAYESGIGVEQDSNSAIDYYNKSCKLRFTDGCKKIQEYNNNFINENKTTENFSMTVKTIHDFLTDYLDSGCFSSIDDVSLYFSTNIKRYFGLINPTHKLIYGDNAAYCIQWTQRNYSLENFTIERSYYIDGIEHVDVAVDINFEVSNDEKNLSGTSRQLMTLAFEDGRIKIKQVYAAKS